MHLWTRAAITALMPTQPAALSLLPGNDAQPARGPRAPGYSTAGTTAACGPSSGGVAWRGMAGTPATGTHRPRQAALAAGDVMRRARPCLQSSPQSSVRGKVWALQTRAGAAPPPHAGACRAWGQPQAAREGAAGPPCAAGMGAPQVPRSPSTHIGVQHPQQHPPAPAAGQGSCQQGPPLPGSAGDTASPGPPHRPVQPSGYFLPQEASPSPGPDPAHPASPLLHPARRP